MQTKTKNTYSENFLNNQNYILGKSEKKKLLSKFFVEKSFNDILNLLNNFSNILYYLSKYLYSLLFLFITLFLIREFEFSIGTGIYFLWAPILIIILPLFIKNNKYKNGMIYNIGDYFINKEIYLSKSNEYEIQKSINFIIIISFSFLLSGLISYIINFWKFFFHTGLFITFLIFFKYKKQVMGFNIFNTILFPFIFIIQLIYIILSLFNTYIMRGIKGYTFIKIQPIGMFLKKFYILDKKFAENEFYEIKLK